MLRYLMAVIGLVFMTAAVAAQTTVIDTTVDFTPILQSIVGIAAVVLTSLATWLGFILKGWASTKWDLSQTDLDDKLQVMFNAAIRRAIDYGTAKANEFLKDKVTIDVKSEIIKRAADYFMEFWPDLVIKLGLTAEQIAKMIEARLPPTTAAEVKTAIEVTKVVAEKTAIADAGKSA